MGVSYNMNPDNKSEPLFVCYDCEIETDNEDDVIYIEAVSDYICTDCLDENYFTCDRCDEYHSTEETYCIQDDYWCEYCYENYSVYCESCDCSYDEDNVSVNSSNHCEDCANEYNENDVIHSYSYKPDIIVGLLQFNKSFVNQESDPSKASDPKEKVISKLVHVGQNAYNRIIDKKTKLDQDIFKTSFGNYEDTAEIIGFELEVENKTNGEKYRSTNDLATDFIEVMDDKDENHVYLKSDGSLSNGFEIVTHPKSYSAWMKDMTRFQPMFDLPRNGIRSHDTQTCGLHFSLNRKAFSPIHLLKFSTFIYWNPIFIKDISRRSWQNLTSWANVFSSYDYDTVDDKQIKSIMASQKNIENNLYRNTFYTKCGDLFHPLYTKKALINNRRNIRNTAINLPESRVECRFFRGTLKKDTFIMNLQFVHSLFEFTKQEKFENLSIFDFLKFNKKNDFHYVNEYLNLLPTDQIRFYHDYYMDAVRNERDFKDRKEPCAVFTMRDDDNYKIKPRS